MLCCNPVILLDPDFKRKAAEYGCIVINKKLVATGCEYRIPNINKFFPKRNGITRDNYQDSYFLNSVTGEMSPLYMCVPCGKCILCKDRKVKEMAARCVAETNLHGKVPYFITFTYDDKHLPEEGLRKRDIQMFLKRLRAMLVRDKLSNKLRYLAVGEYGSKKGRPHYHVILWNFPDDSVFFPNIISIRNYIQRAWSVFKKDERGKRIPIRRPDGSLTGLYETEVIGSIKVLPMKDGCPAYVLKYMKKQCIHSVGRTPTFQTASNRGGGIGSAFIRSRRDFFLQHPTLTHLALTDKVVSGKVIKMPITSYVKNLMLPSVSASFKKKEYQLLRDFYTDLELLDAVLLRARELYGLDETLYDRYARPVVKSWDEPFFDWRSRPDIVDAVNKTDYFPSLFRYQWHTDVNMSYIKDKDTLWDYYYTLMDELQLLTPKVLQLPDLRLYFCARKKFIKERHDDLQTLYGNAEDINIEYLSEVTEKRVLNSIYKETF